MKKKKTNLAAHQDFCYIMFIDPTYKEGWVERGELPNEEDAIHAGVGTMIKWSKKAIWLAFAEELLDRTSQVMHPQMIHWECIIKLYFFDEELFDEIFRSRTSKRIKDKVCRAIDKPIGDYK